MDSVYAIGGYYEEFIKELNYEEDLIFENMLTWEVAYGCLNNFEFAQKIRKDEKLLKCDELMRILTTCYLNNDIINKEMIEKYPPYYLTYPKIISDETFDELLKYQNEELKIPLCIVALIKNKEDIFLKLDPDAYVITNSFAKQYNRVKCIEQQNKKAQIKKGYNTKYLFIRRENTGKNYTSYNLKINTKLYLKYYVSRWQYLFWSFPDYFDENCIGTLGLDYVNIYDIFYFSYDREFENININKNLYNDPVQVAYVYNNLEKFDNETCRTALTKLILSQVNIKEEIIKKYKPYDLTKELVFGYDDIKEKYPSIKKDIEKAEEKFKNMTDGTNLIKLER